MCLALWIFLLPVATHGHEASLERNLHFTQLNFPPHPHRSQGHHAQLCRPPPEDALFSLHKRSSSRHHNSRVGICHLRRHLWFSDHLKSVVAIINVIRHTQLSKGLLQACLHVPSYEVHVRVVRILQPILDEAVNFVEAHVYILVLLIWMIFVVMNQRHVCSLLI